MKLFIISGISGAGKSVVLHALEDLGFYCTDNLPVAMLPEFAAEMVKSMSKRHHSAAVGIDARNSSNDLSEFSTTLEQLEKAGIDCQIIFLDADDATLIKRFSETRRRHPLTSEDIPLEEAIHQERLLLKPVSSQADKTLDTSQTNVHQLRDLVKVKLGKDDTESMAILFQSFGFKHGIPVEADFVFDVRCLPNPHWNKDLRGLSGQDPEVVSFLENETSVGNMFTDICHFIERWIPEFEGDNRTYLTIAIGCTGGQHRSVYFVERLSRHFKDRPSNTLARHRELP
ncbi:MAG: RNase adapter RapZ [Gammaproteobacteria bacterium]|nr:RNase adapter RapZ [Gammaproteobacteria bacterium]